MSTFRRRIMMAVSAVGKYLSAWFHSEGWFHSEAW